MPASMSNNHTVIKSDLYPGVMADGHVHPEAMEDGFLHPGAIL